MAACIGFSTCSFPASQPVWESLAFALAHGFEALELEVNDSNFVLERLDADFLRRIQHLTASRALRVGIHSPGDADLSDASRTGREDAIRRIWDSIALAAELGAETVVVHPGRVPGGRPSPAVEEAWNQNVLAIRDLARRALRQGVRVSVENLCHDKESVAPDIRAFGRLCEEIGRDLVRVTLDTNHAALIDGLEASLAAVSDLVNYIHFSSNKGLRSDHCEPAVGVVDFAPMRGFLKAFEGPIMIELNASGEGSGGAILRTRNHLKKLTALLGESA